MLGILQQDAVHIGTSILKQLVIAVEYDNDNLALAQHAQLVGLFHEAKLALGECDLTIALVGDLRYSNFLSAHLFLLRPSSSSCLLI